VIEGKLEGRIEMTGRRGKRRKQLLDDLEQKKILEIERGSTRSHPVENSLWKRLWTCRKTDYSMNDISVTQILNTLQYILSRNRADLAEFIIPNLRKYLRDVACLNHGSCGSLLQKISGTADLSV
jgi:hypothetical protein